MKILIKIIINIFVIFVLVWIIEFSLLIYRYNKDYERLIMRHNLENNNECFNFFKYIDNIKEQADRKKSYFIEPFRKPSIVQNARKKSIIISGCSFAYGEFLKENETPNYLLSKLTNRSVYNIALSAAGPREALYFFRCYNDKNKILNNDKNIEYVIYIYINDHKYRSCLSLRNFYPKFKIINNKGVKTLKYYNEHLIFRYKPFYLSELYNKFLYEQYYQKTGKSNDILMLYIREINKEIKNLYGKNTKFVFFIYENSENIDFSELNKEGIIVLCLKDIGIEINTSDEKYTFPDGHPNKAAWDIILPALVKKLNL